MGYSECTQFGIRPFENFFTILDLLIILMPRSPFFFIYNETEQIFHFAILNGRFF